MSEERSRAITRQVLRKLTQDTEPWLSCDDCFEMLDEYVDRRMADPDDVDVAMATHLEACPACAEEAESLVALVAKGE
jgi:anti-sigma factor RsiW